MDAFFWEGSGSAFYGVEREDGLRGPGGEKADEDDAPALVGDVDGFAIGRRAGERERLAEQVETAEVVGDAGA